MLRIHQVRTALLLGMLVRTPMWAGGVLLTLHVVGTLGESYSAAGFVTMASTAAIAISGPWRGRRLDQIGLRRTIAPQLLVLAVVWSIAPFVPYWPLLILVAIAGLAVVPSFSIVRQVLITAVEDEQRKTVLSLDALAVEVTFMVGPVLGVLAATYVDTRWALLGFEMLSVFGGLMIWVANPRLVSEDEGTGERVGVRSWLSPMVLAILGASAAATIVLTGSDLSIVAALRSMGSPELIGWVLAVWGLGSAVGALLYGAIHRPISVFVLLLLLGLATIPVIFADGIVLMTLALFVAGLFCAPTITATIEALSRAVPANVRGEAMGWHGSSLTLGTAAGAPVAGFAIDHGGWEVGFLVTAVLGVAVAFVGLAIRARRRAVAQIS